MHWGTSVFTCAVPREAPRNLRPDQASAAVDCWMDKKQPRPLPELLPVAGVSPFSPNVKTIYRFDDTRWFQWNDEVDVVRAPLINDSTNRTIWTGENTGGSTFPRFTSTVIMMGGGFTSPGLPISLRLGIPVPTQDPTAAAGALTDEDPDGTPQFHAWVYTFVSNLGEEGAPSDPTTVIQRGFNADGTIQPVTITMPAAVSGPYNITHKRLYRTVTGASGATSYQLVAQIPLTTATFTDTALIASLGSALITTTWDPPAEDLKGIIALPNGVLAAFRGREVHFSEPYQPHAWPSDYIQVVEKDIVGLDNFGSTVVVGTKGSAELINLSDPKNAAAVKMELNQACISGRSFAYIDLQGVVYASPDGLVLVGPSGGKIVTESVYNRENWQALAPENLRSVYHDGAYLGFLTDKAISFDRKQEGAVETSDVVNAVFHDRERDKLYVVDDSDNMLKEWVSSAEVSAVLRSARWCSYINVGLARTFSAAQVIANGYPIHFRLFADSDRTAIWETEVTGPNPFRLPSSLGLHGEWQYEVEGQHTVEEVRIGGMREMIWHGGGGVGPPITPPGDPETPTLVSRTPRSLRVSTVRGTGGPPSRYRWRYSLDAAVEDTDPKTTSSGTEATISGLAPDTAYWIDVRAENSGGESGYSGDLMATTAALMPPGTPATPTLVEAEETTLLVQTTPGGGGSPNLYRWRISTDVDVTDADRIETSINPMKLITGLVAETDYWIDVRAENTDGDSAYSGDLMASTVMAPPPAVTTKYFLLTLDATVPTAADFLASPITFDGDTAPVPAHLDQRFYHCAHLRNDISNIHEEDYHENFRDQWTAMASLPTRTINGTTYYVYTTLYAQYPIGVSIPIVFEES